MSVWIVSCADLICSVVADVSGDRPMICEIPKKKPAVLADFVIWSADWLVMCDWKSVWFYLFKRRTYFCVGSCAAVPVPDSRVLISKYLLFEAFSDTFQRTVASSSRPANCRSEVRNSNEICNCIHSGMYLEMLVILYRTCRRRRVILKEVIPASHSGSTGFEYRPNIDCNFSWPFY